MELLKPVEVSAWLKVTQGTMANWRSMGDGPPYIKVGSLARYRREDVETWLAGRIQTPPPLWKETP